MGLGVLFWSSIFFFLFSVFSILLALLFSVRCTFPLFCGCILVLPGASEFLFFRFSACFIGSSSCVTWVASSEATSSSSCGALLVLPSVSFESSVSSVRMRFVSFTSSSSVVSSSSLMMSIISTVYSVPVLCGALQCFSLFHLSVSFISCTVCSPSSVVVVVCILSGILYPRFAPPSVYHIMCVTMCRVTSPSGEVTSIVSPSCTLLISCPCILQWSLFFLALSPGGMFLFFLASRDAGSASTAH